MSVSVVMPVYNGERYLAEALDSVRAQTLPAWEVILVDDGSTDATPVIAQEYARRDGRIRVLHQGNQGISAARNQGFAASNPAFPYVIFLDHDDIWVPDTLETLGEVLENKPSLAAAHGLAWYIDAEGLPLSGAICAEPARETTSFSLLAHANHIPTPGLVLMRRTAFIACGGFDTALRGCEDWDLWLQIARDGDIACIDKLLLGYRRHGASASNNTAVVEAAGAAIRRKWPQIPPEP